jgi:hypothetical protein
MLSFLSTFFHNIAVKQYPTFVAAALAAVFQALAFTNGSLVPSYICNPTPDGLPKSYGQLLPFTSLQLGTIAFNANGLSNIMTIIYYTKLTRQLQLQTILSLHQFPNKVTKPKLAIRLIFLHRSTIH